MGRRRSTFCWFFTGRLSVSAAEGEQTVRWAVGLVTDAKITMQSDGHRGAPVILHSFTFIVSQKANVFTPDFLNYFYIFCPCSKILDLLRTNGSFFSLFISSRLGAMWVGGTLRRISTSNQFGIVGSNDPHLFCCHFTVAARS